MSDSLHYRAIVNKMKCEVCEAMTIELGLFSLGQPKPNLAYVGRSTPNSAHYRSDR